MFEKADQISIDLFILPFFSVCGPPTKKFGHPRLESFAELTIARFKRDSFVLFWFVCSLQTLVLDANRLSSLPAELGSLEALVYLGLSFNRFTCTPPVLEKLNGMERLCLAGNQISVVHMAGLQRLSTRHIDLR